MSYYNNCPFPKPGTKKKKKKANGWKNKKDRYCYYTGQPYAERHEVFGRSNRQISIDNKFQVDLHPAIHKLFHGEVDHKALKELDVQGMYPHPEIWAEKEIKRWRQHYQQKHESELIDKGMTAASAKQYWITWIGENYL